MGSSGSRFDECLQAGTGERDIISNFYVWVRVLQRYHYKYVVLTTRRASNLIEALRKEHPDILPNYITENGLLLLAETVVDSYMETGHFPKIAIVDDILVYGRNMNLLLSQFWITIRQSLRQRDVDVDEETAEEAFIQSINLWIYAVNEAPILLRHEFQLTMRSQKMLAESDWRSLSDSIARLIAKEDVPNTSYVISAKLRYRSDHYRPNHLSWRKDEKLRYRDNHQQYTFYLFSPAQRPGVYPSVRSYKKQDFLYFTPYFFMPSLDWPQAIRILKSIFDISVQQDLDATNGCIYLLNSIKECSSRLMVYAQFTILLLSQITLSVFFEHLDPQIELIYDTEKIARNFGVSKDINPILKRFCAVKWGEPHLIALLNSLEFPDTARKAPNVPTAKGIDQAEIVNTVERLVYKQAVDHEGDAGRRKKYDLSDSPNDPHVNRTGEQELDQFLARVQEKTSTCANTEAMLPILSCLTQMMDLGDISLKARFKRRNGIPEFYSSVRTTEMSLAIMPRKLSVYYRQFYLLARLYWRDQDLPDRVEHYFRNVIFDGDPEDKNAVMIENARYFAQLIVENRTIVNSMLNWQVMPGSEL